MAEELPPKIDDVGVFPLVPNIEVPSVSFEEKMDFSALGVALPNKAFDDGNAIVDSFWLSGGFLVEDTTLLNVLAEDNVIDCGFSSKKDEVVVWNVDFGVLSGVAFARLSLMKTSVMIGLFAVVSTVCDVGTVVDATVELEEKLKLVRVLDVKAPLPPKIEVGFDFSSSVVLIVCAVSLFKSSKIPLGATTIDLVLEDVKEKGAAAPAVVVSAEFLINTDDTCEFGKVELVLN